MPYVQRDSDGKINGLFANPQEWMANEYLPDDHPEVVAFASPSADEGLKTVDAPAAVDVQTPKIDSNTARIDVLETRVAALEAKAG